MAAKGAQGSEHRAQGKPSRITAFNQSKFVKNDNNPGEKESLMITAREAVAVALGRQLLKRGLINFDIEEQPGPNAGQRRVTVKGSVSVNTRPEDIID